MRNWHRRLPIFLKRMIADRAVWALVVLMVSILAIVQALTFAQQFVPVSLEVVAIISLSSASSSSSSSESSSESSSAVVSSTQIVPPSDDGTRPPSGAYRYSRERMARLLQSIVLRRQQQRDASSSRSSSLSSESVFPAAPVTSSSASSRRGKPPETPTIIEIDRPGVLVGAVKKNENVVIQPHLCQTDCPFWAPQCVPMILWCKSRETRHALTESARLPDTTWMFGRHRTELFLWISLMTIVALVFWWILLLLLLLLRRRKHSPSGASPHEKPHIHQRPQHRRFRFGRSRSQDTSASNDL